MKIAEYVELYTDDENLVLDICDEMDALAFNRRISTREGMESLCKELDAKYRRIATLVDADPYLFQDVIQQTNPQLYRGIYAQDSSGCNCRCFLSFAV